MAMLLRARAVNSSAHPIASRTLAPISAPSLRLPRHSQSRYYRNPNILNPSKAPPVAHGEIKRITALLQDGTRRDKAEVKQILRAIPNKKIRKQIGHKINTVLYKVQKKEDLAAAAVRKQARQKADAEEKAEQAAWDAQHPELATQRRRLLSQSPRLSADVLPGTRRLRFLNVRGKKETKPSKRHHDVSFEADLHSGDQRRGAWQAPMAQQKTGPFYISVGVSGAPADTTTDEAADSPTRQRDPPHAGQCSR